MSQCEPLLRPMPVKRLTAAAVLMVVACIGGYLLTPKWQAVRQACFRQLSFALRATGRCAMHAVFRQIKAQGRLKSSCTVSKLFRRPFFRRPQAFAKRPFHRLRGCGRYSEMQEKRTQNCILPQHIDSAIKY